MSIIHRELGTRDEGQPQELRVPDVQVTPTPEPDSDHERWFDRTRNRVVLAVGAVGAAAAAVLVFTVGGGGEGESVERDTTEASVDVTTPATTTNLETAGVFEIDPTAERIDGEPWPLAGETPTDVLLAYRYNMEQAIQTRDMRFLDVMGIGTDEEEDPTAGLRGVISGWASDYLYVPAENRYQMNVAGEVPQSFGGGNLVVSVTEDISLQSAFSDEREWGIYDVELEFSANPEGYWELERHTVLNTVNGIPSSAEIFASDQ